MIKRNTKNWWSHTMVTYPPEGLTIRGMFYTIFIVAVSDNSFQFVIYKHVGNPRDCTTSY